MESKSDLPRTTDAQRPGTRSKVIAVDFDGTLFKTEYPTILSPISDVIDRAKSEKKSGAKLILWTCREGEVLEEAIAACREQGLEFDAINENTEELKALWGNDPRKVAADEYWDDKAVRCYGTDMNDYLTHMSQTTPIWVTVSLIRSTSNEAGVYEALKSQLSCVSADLLRAYLWQFIAVLKYYQTLPVPSLTETDMRAVQVITNVGEMLEEEIQKQEGRHGS